MTNVWGHAPKLSMNNFDAFCLFSVVHFDGGCDN